MDGRDLALSARRAQGRRLATLAALAALPLAVLCVFFVLPVAGMLRRGVVVDGHVDLGAVWDVLARPRTRRVVWFTAWSAAAGTAASLVLGIAAAHALYRLRTPGRAALTVPFVLPTVVVGIAFREVMGPAGPLAFLGLDGTPVAILLALVFFNASVVMRGVGSAWQSMDPRPAEAAAALGATPWRVLRTVTLPALGPAIASSATIVFLFCATAFGVVLTLGGLRYSTVETEIYLLTNNLLDLPAAAALSIVQLMMVTTLLAVAGRSRRRVDVARVPPRPRGVRRGDAPAVAATLVLAALVALPLVTLVRGALRVDGGYGLDNFRALQTAGPGDALAVTATDALATSLRTAVDATWMALLIGIPIAVAVTRTSRSAAERRLRGALDGAFMLPLGVSAVTLGFGFLVTLDRPPLDLRDSPLLVPVAQALVALPLVVRVLTPVLGGIDEHQRQAAASLGAGPLRVLATVDLPVVWRPLLVAAGFAMAVSLGEFGATSFLARDDRPTLPVVVYQLISRPGAVNHGMALAASVVLAAACAVVILAVERLRVPGMDAL